MEKEAIIKTCHKCGKEKEVRTRKAVICMDCVLEIMCRGPEE